jgi:hypothetical protein
MRYLGCPVVRDRMKAGCPALCAGMLLRAETIRRIEVSRIQTMDEMEAGPCDDP